jgi:uncharacterized protein
MILLDLREFEEFPASATLSAGPGQIGADDDRLVKIDEATVRLAIQMSHEEFFCQGQIDARLTLECARCLTPFTVEVSEPVDFIIRSETRESEPGAIDDEDYVFFKGNDLTADIVDPVRQAIVLSLPLKPLCREDCRGLCPQCRINWNEGSCDCEVKVNDPRWDGLKDLFPRK